MATNTKRTRRLLNDGEIALVDRTSRGALAALELKDLTDLVRQLRERRDRARDIARRQRRDLRGKGAGRETYDQADSGNRQKAALLGEALSRARKMRSKREEEACRPQIAAARKALALKRKAEKPRRPHPGRTAGKGLRPNPNEKVERIGSPMEAGRVSQFVRDAQAKRDNRGGEA